MNNMATLLPVYGVKPWMIVMIVVIVVLVAALVALSIYGKKLQDRQEQSQKDLQAAAQSVSMLVIDKKRMKLKEAGLPQIVLEQTPKRFRGQKVPIVKAKVGPKIMSLMCEEKIFESIPVKKEIKAMVSGIYIMEVKGLRTGLENAPGKKLTFRDKMKAKLAKTQSEISDEKKKNKK